MNQKVCILNYGSGNVKSVYNMLLSLSKDVVISNKADDICNASHIILPGVGAFGASMDKIKNKIPLKILEDNILNKKKPFLGICVGMQVLSQKGYEFGEHAGLAWIAGRVERLDSHELPLPHIGWNNIEIVNSSALLQDLKDNQDFYFVHSFVFKALNPENIIAQTEYGEKFISIINQDNIYGVQFHPEKSQKAGKLLMSNFLKLK